VLFYNFDVDGSDLKKEHLGFVHDLVLFFLDDGPDARVPVVGQASLTGLEHHVFLRQRKWSRDGVGTAPEALGRLAHSNPWVQGSSSSSTGSKVRQIAASMGQKITAGLHPDQWV